MNDLRGSSGRTPPEVFQQPAQGFVADNIRTNLELAQRLELGRPATSQFSFSLR